MNKDCRFQAKLVSILISLCMLSACGSNSSIESDEHGVKPLFSSNLWNAIRSWNLFPSTSSSLALWIFIIIGICSAVFIFKRYNRVFPAIAISVIGLCQIFLFLGYTGRPEGLCESYFVAILLIFALTSQLLTTDKIAIDHNLTGDYYAAKDSGILGIIFSASVILVPLLYYIFVDFFGWSIVGWLLKLFELWLFALIVNLIYGAVTDRLDSADNEPKVYYIAACIISFIGFLITICYNTISGYIASIITIVYLMPRYWGSHKAYVRIRKTVEAEEIMKIRKGAESGDPWDICRLGERYWSGKGIEKDYNKAFELFSRAVELDNKVAYWDLARCYDHGWGAPFNPQKAVDLYKEAYKRGVIEACHSLGRLYDKEEYGLCNSAESFNWFLKGAEGGDVDCQFRVAECYEKGIGVIKNIDTSMEWWKAAADNGNDVSACHYGIYMYEHGHRNEGLQYLRRAREKGNDLAKEYMNHYNLR